MAQAGPAGLPVPGLDTTPARGNGNSAPPTSGNPLTPKIDPPTPLLIDHQSGSVQTVKNMPMTEPVPRHPPWLKVRHPYEASRKILHLPRYRRALLAWLRTTEGRRTGLKVAKRRVRSPAKPDLSPRRRQQATDHRRHITAWLAFPARRGVHDEMVIDAWHLPGIGPGVTGGPGRRFDGRPPWSSRKPAHLNQ